MTIMQPPVRHSLIERSIETLIFACRWLLAPIFIGLAAGIVVLLIKFAQRTWELLSHVLTADGDSTIIGILGLVDLPAEFREAFFGAMDYTVVGRKIGAIRL